MSVGQEHEVVELKSEAEQLIDLDKGVREDYRHLMLAVAGSDEPLPNSRPYVAINLKPLDGGQARVYGFLDSRFSNRDARAVVDPKAAKFFEVHYHPATSPAALEGYREPVMAGLPEECLKELQSSGNEPLHPSIIFASMTFYIRASRFLDRYKVAAMDRELNPAIAERVAQYYAALEQAQAGTGEADSAETLGYDSHA